MEKYRPLLTNSSSCGALNTKNWTKTEGTTTSKGWATPRTPKQTSQHHLLWLKQLSAVHFVKISDSSGWGSTISPVHDWTLLSTPGDGSHLGQRFPNAVFTCAYPKSHRQKFRFSSTKLLGHLRAQFVSVQQRFGSTRNLKPSESQTAWELHGKILGPELNECWKTGKVRNDAGGGEAGTADGFCSKKETIPQKQEQGWQNKG